MCLLLLGTLLSTAAWAQFDGNASAARSIEADIEALKGDVKSARTMDARRPLLERASALQERAVALQTALADPVARIEKRIALLGADAASSPDAEVRQQHLELTGTLDEQVALTRRTALSEAEAQQLLNSLAEAQARAMGEELFQQTASPLMPSLWTKGIASLRRDLDRSRSESVAVTPARSIPMLLLAFLAWAAVAWVLLVPGQRALDRLGTRLADTLAGREARFSLSLFAVWSVIVGVLLPTVCAWLLLIGVHRAALPALVVDLGGAMITAVVFGFFVRETALAILQPRSRMWRLWKVSDAAAALGARAGNSLASAIALVIAIEATLGRLGASPETQVFLHSVLALVSVVQIAYALYMLGLMHRLDSTLETAEEVASRGRVALLVGVGWIAVAGLALFGVLGYVNFANRFSQWAIWGAIVFLSTYILMAFVDGLCRLLASATTRVRAGSQANRALQQAAVLLSAICRLLLLLLAFGAVLVPFGAGFTSVLELLAPLAKGFDVGGVTISAAAIFRALLTFFVVIALIRFIRAWITSSYLPTTSLQPDAQDSIDKILRYVGIVLAALWALTAFGVGMEKVAILASALSVGIGFGLQAITQNFVSGLILLVERPVKIGDWVKLNDVEGDIRRINVRSTEIRVGDHSTMIVPNSELITKVVQNMTMGNSLGRAQILLSVPAEADLDEAIEAISAVLAADDDVLDAPAPAVFLDRVEGGMAVLNCFIHVRSPRVAYGVRSRVTLTALRTLREHGIPVSLPAQQFVIAPSPPA